MTSFAAAAAVAGQPGLVQYRASAADGMSSALKKPVACVQASVWFNYLGSRKRFWYAASLNTVVRGWSWQAVPA
jgi:hypothetical protein